MPLNHSRGLPFRSDITRVHAGRLWDGTGDYDFVKTCVRARAATMREPACTAHEELGVRSGSHFLSPGIDVGNRFLGSPCRPDDDGGEAIRAQRGAPREARGTSRGVRNPVAPLLRARHNPHNGGQEELVWTCSRVPGAGRS